jgi:hypothetical protein
MAPFARKSPTMTHMANIAIEVHSALDKEIPLSLKMFLTIFFSERK